MNQYLDTASPTANQPRPAARFHWHAAIHALLVFAVAVGLMAIPSASQAAPTAKTWYVKPTGNDALDCLSLNTACQTIQTALDKAASGDTIIIAAGVYEENLQILRNAILQGADQVSTIVDGGAIGAVLFISEDITVNLSGLTLRNGRTAYGSGLTIDTGAVVNISNSRITGNTGLNGGGGILNQGQLKLTNVTLSNNVNSGSSDRGGGLLNLGSAELIGGVVSDNQSTENGGGGIGNKGVLTITGSTLSGNQAGSGGAIYNERTLSLNAALISRNHAEVDGGGIYNAGQSPQTASVIDAGSLITENVAATRGGGVFNASTGQLTLMGTNIISNTANDSFGGGLYNAGQTTLAGVSVKNNLAAGSGGGLYSTGDNSRLTLNNSAVMDNRAGSNGGGVYASSISGTLTLNNTQIANNQSNLNGGGLYNDSPASLSDVNLSGNSASTGNGGGIFNGSNGQLTVLQSNLVGNQAAASGGGVFNNPSGRLIATGSTLSQNYSAQAGGGINNRGTLTLTQSSVYSNTTLSQSGSGVYNIANANLINVTVSYNAVLSGTNAGAVFNDNGTLKITNATISHNAAPNIQRQAGSVILANTLVSGSGANCAGGVTSAGHNLDSANTCGFTAAGDLINKDPLLGPLQDNGGSTWTRDLSISSSAVNGGDNANCTSVDQRGVTRPQNTNCDIGAYEAVGYTNNTTQTIPTNGCITATTTITSNDIIGRLQLGVNLNIAPRGDLRVNLYAPFGTVVQTLGATGDSGQNLDVLWDDNSTDGPVGTTEDHNPTFPYFKYVRQPDNPLAVLIGRKVYGDWKLEICSLSSSLDGTLNQWVLVVPNIQTPKPPKVYLPLIRNKK